MDVKPWEPASHYEVWEDGFKSSLTGLIHGSAFQEVRRSVYDPFVSYNVVLLTNGQRIIVRALSEDRKAARSAMKEANQ